MDASSNHTPENPAGGNGGTADSILRPTTRADHQMIRQAVSNGWKIPPELKDALPQILINMLADDKATRREKRLAIETLRKMMLDNLSAAKLMAQIEGDLPPEGAEGDKPVNLTVLIQQTLQGMHAEGEVRQAVRGRLESVLGDGP